ncbi:MULTISPECIES: GntR family transcriptional regulator [unclassified Streptomyces]|uniref:GntR family transcriptional regulator n=1 Tax=unclassified Streptomyces TaxID=2593676 RepID=UPI002DD8006C|nr:GntR family transcriptional regulator [Streptomyces sp. NBC_00243]WRZ24671.1 GntR family transcriptional regulator [Streptomyces sp. NBC_00243]
MCPQPPSTQGETLAVASLADEIAYRLRADILDGRLPFGARLQHEELAARFGVSRTPIREALRQLQALNLVELAPNRGATVRTPSRAELVEVYELRAEMEGFACALACDRASTKDLDQLERTQERLTAAVTSALTSAGRVDDAELDAAVTEANTAFHDLIHQAAANRRLAESIQALQSVFPRDSVWRVIAHDETAMTTMNVTEHQAITAALRARTPESARRVMRDHVHAAGEILLAHLDDQRFWG